jgi:DNA-binding NtrC family response regulator
MERLISYNWPGNVRELENVVERELILNKGEPLTFMALAKTDRNEYAAASIDKPDKSLNLDKVTALHIQRVLKITKGIVHGSGGAANLLGVNPSTLRSKMKKLGISYGRRK